MEKDFQNQTLMKYLHDLIFQLRSKLALDKILHVSKNEIIYIGKQNRSYCHEWRCRSEPRPDQVFLVLLGILQSLGFRGE